MITQALLWLLTLLFSTTSSVEQVKLHPIEQGSHSCYGEIGRQDPYSFPLSDKIGALLENNTAEESENSEDENETHEFSEFDQLNTTTDILKLQGCALSLLEKSRRRISALQPALYILHCTWKSEIE